MPYQNLLFNVDDGIGTITFNRPKALNALNNALLAEFSDLLAEVAENEEIRVLVLTGAGDRAFVAGADITELATFNPIQGKAFAKKGQETIQALQELPIPAIAAVNGFALGGGTEMALAADFIYASESANFGLPEITLGLIPGFGGTQRLPRLISSNRAKEIIFTGGMIKAQDALEMGIVNRVCAAEKLMEETMDTARKIGAKGKVSLRAAKEAVNNGLNADLKTGLLVELDGFALCMASGDAKEGTSAFLEKRKAEFKGKRNE